jgi:regulator of replication initiation timing
MNVEVNAQAVIDSLLEQNKQLVFEIAVLQARLGLSKLDDNQSTDS